MLIVALLLLPISWLSCLVILSLLIEPLGRWVMTRVWMILPEGFFLS